MKFNSIDTIKIEEKTEVTYFLTEDIHFVEDYGMICEYGIAISSTKKGIDRCTFAQVPHICDDKNFVGKIISLLVKEQALPIHLNDIVEDLLC